MANNNEYLNEMTRFGQYLDDIGYADCFHHYTNMPFQYKDCLSFLSQARSVLPCDARIAIRLLTLGESVGIDEINRTGLKSFIPSLKACGILTEDNGTLKINRLQCQVVDGCYLFVSSVTTNQEIVAYFGDDSIKLTRHHIGSPGQLALDICCGSGIQSILLARRGMQVTGVDIQASALKLAEINCRINRVHQLTRFINSDIGEFKPDQPFDVVVSNPPLLPIADAMKYSIVGDGGESGLEITSEIVEKIHAIPNNQTRAVIIGTCLGTDNITQVQTWLEAILANRDTSAMVFLISRLSATGMSEGLAYTTHLHFGESYIKAARQMVDLCKRNHSNYIYTFVVKLQRGVHKSSIIVVPMYKKAKRFSLWYVA